MNTIKTGLAGAFALAALAAPASAQEGAAFFNGKTVNYIVATAPGGGYDSYGRLIAEFMQKYLPGSTFVVRNMPGAGHLIGTNALYASKPDGLTLGTFNTGLIYNQLVANEGVKFDLNKFSWIGKAASDARVFAIAAQSPIKTWQDLASSKEPVNFSTAGVGSASYVETVILTKALKLPIRIQTGYNGSDDQLAMRRGEIVGSIASRSSYDQFIKNGYGRYIAQIGGNDKDVPQLKTLVKDPAGLELLALIESTSEIARLTAAPPAVPAPQLAALRDAYKKAIEDSELQARAEKLERPVEPLYGDDIAKMIAAALKQSPETIALLKESMSKK
ncbi:MAG: Bug family tripartite tricarboxylate transporter substrate binding protein [Beijerinckiaceae bacterium]|jgi:tripartite-type tricarboxylate transporter receptor subunit TctC